MKEIGQVFEYPIFFKKRTQFIEDFHECELGHWEYCEKNKKGQWRQEVPGGEDSEEWNSHGHTVQILERNKSKIEIRCQEELEEIWVSLCSGTITYYHLKQAQSLADKMLKVDKSLKKLWSYPQCGN